MHNKTLFLVVGMHRSGTSLTTNCLSSMGLSMSENLVDASSDNPDGFFEDSFIVNINDRIERELDREHMSVAASAPYPDEWQKMHSIEELSNQIREYIGSNLKNLENWTIKDPRLTRTLPIYTKVFDDLGIDLNVVFVHRHPASVVRSKSSRDKISEFLIDRHWLISNVSALDTLSKMSCPTYIVNYERLVTEPEKELEKLYLFVQSKTLSEITKPEVSKIKGAGAEEKFKKDIEMTDLSENSMLLHELLSGIGAKEIGKNDWVEIQRFTERYNHDIESESGWNRFLLEEGARLNESNQNARNNVVLRDQLKQSNSRVFGLTNRNKELTHQIREREVDLDKANKMLEGLEILQKAVEVELHALKSSYLKLDAEHKALSLKQRTKIFRIANNLDKLKLKIYDRGLLRVFPVLKNILGRLKFLLIRTRRSLNNNGLKRTAFIVLGFLKKEIKSAVSADARNKKNRLKKESISEFQQGRELILAKYNSLPENKIRMILGIFVREYYISVASLAPDTNFSDALSHFLNVGQNQNLSPGPLFNEDVYNKSAGSLSDEKEALFSHWLLHGIDNRVIPTNLFDEVYFINRHALRLDEDQWSFERFLIVSINNHASPNQYFDSNWYRQNHDLGDSFLPAFYHYLIVGYKLGWRPSAMFPSYSRLDTQVMKISPLEFVMNSLEFRSNKSRIFQSPTLQYQVKKAKEIEPQISLEEDARRINFLPFTNPYFPAAKALRRLLKHSSYDSVVLIPHCRYGGSGLVAGILCEVLSEIRPKERVLLVRTDNDDFLRPDWFPENLEIVNLLDFACDLNDLHRGKLLLDILIGLKPRRIINVHSRLGWEIFREFGDRLKLWSSLYAYSFCYDVNAMGAKVGYPIKYVPSCIPHLTYLMVDNRYLKTDLIKQNRWCDELSNKIKVIHTPYDQDPMEKLDSQANNLKIIKEKPGKKKIFWAGRFDRQKRFDLVVKLAKRNPDWEFFVWGGAMLGDGDSFETTPDNMTLYGLFKQYEELPIHECDVWLYTSQWDGVPTILIELGLREVPLVAACVWGTRDLINDQTSFPVEDVKSVVAYEDAIKQALLDPKEAVARAKRLRKLILDQHDRGKYSECLSSCINDDHWRAAR